PPRADAPRGEEPEARRNARVRERDLFDYRSAFGRALGNEAPRDRSASNRIAAARHYERPQRDEVEHREAHEADDREAGPAHLDGGDDRDRTEPRERAARAGGKHEGNEPRRAAFGVWVSRSEERIDASRGERARDEHPKRRERIHDRVGEARRVRRREGDAPRDRGRQDERRDSKELERPASRLSRHRVPPT